MQRPHGSNNVWKLTALSQPSADWDDFVAGHPKASIYLSSGWSLLASNVFGHTAWFIEARDSGGRLQGILPVLHQKTFLGNFATSIAFFNYGGALCDDPELVQQLMEHARLQAERNGCAYLECRDTQLRSNEWTVRTDKVSMILELPSDKAMLAKQLGTKLRAQIKRADREDVTTRIGGRELVRDFYEVFCRNMRDLGTPVYPIKFFDAILRRFSGHCAVVVIYRGDQPAAAGFIVTNNELAEIPWAACRDDAKPAGFNMKLYWEVLGAAIDRGCTRFDFGRSTVDSGTYRFKKQWGAQPLQLYWHRWERRPRQEAGQDGNERGMMRYAVSIWRRLPLSVANALGPWISPGLPW